MGFIFFQYLGRPVQAAPPARCPLLLLLPDREPPPPGHGVPTRSHAAVIRHKGKIIFNYTYRGEFIF